MAFTMHSSSSFAPPSTSSSATPFITSTHSSNDFTLYNSTVNQALASSHTPHPANFSSNSTTESRRDCGRFPNPRVQVHNHQTTQLLHDRKYVPATVRHDSALLDASVAAYDWQSQPMYNTPGYTSMGGGQLTGTIATNTTSKGIKRARSHQRTPSASTINSAGPASPFMQNGSYPQIANTEQSPSSPGFYYADQTLAKNLPTPSQTPADSAFSRSAYAPSQGAHMSSAHLAMKSFGFDHHNSEDFTPDFAPSRQSMSSHGNDSPATPQSYAGDMESKSYSLPQQQNEYRQNPALQLFRTESAAYQDELYNPNVVYTSAPAKQSSQYLAPHRNLLTERLQTANLARSASPSSAVSRDRSPFRDGSPLAPTKDWAPTDGRIATAASMRQQQKEEAAQKEFAQQQRATLRREPTKTISPKDAVLDYHEDAPSLFQDNIPAGYERHLGGTEQWPTNGYLSQPNPAFGDMTGQQNMSFRNATADAGFADSSYDYSSALPHGTEQQQQIQNNPFQANYQAAVAAKMNNTFSETPDFPATIPSMETSISDAGMPNSSQDSVVNTSTPQRPDDTRANTGTYTCTYHGCTQRFDSHANLQKHKRDYHRSQQSAKESTSPSGTGSVSPRSTESPGPSSNGMTSAALLARNSQAGPHKCTRINPSTNKPCNTIFSRPYDLTRHEDTIHNNRKQKVRCPMCREEKTFSRNDALTRHMRVVHPEVESFGKRGRRD